MNTSLLRAYQACLWLTENILGLPATERIGAHLKESSPPKFIWSRTSLIQNLPDEYFEYSLYSQLPSEATINLLRQLLDECSLEPDNMKGYIQYFQETSFDFSNLVDGDLMMIEGNRYFEDFSPSRRQHYFTSTGRTDDITSLVPDKRPTRFVRKPIELRTEEKGNFFLRGENSKEATSQQGHRLIEALITKLKKESKKYQKQTTDIKALSQLAAHYVLIILLQTRIIDAEAKEGACFDIDHLCNDPTLIQKHKLIPPHFWLCCPIPNYELSGCELGTRRLDKLLGEHLQNKEKMLEQYYTKSDYWFRDITVSDSFATWFRSQEHEANYCPENATFKKLPGKKFYIQFGYDEEFELNSNLAERNLFRQIKQLSHGVSRISHEDLILDDAIENSSKDAQASKTKTKDRKITAERRHKNFIYWCLKKMYLENLSNQDDEKIRGVLNHHLKELEKLVQDGTEQITSIREIIHNIDLQISINNDRSFLKKIMPALKEKLRVDLTPDERYIDSQRSLLNKLLKTIEQKSPSLFQKIGKLKRMKNLSTDQEGIYYDEEYLYLFSDTLKAVQWDFGDN